MGKCDYTLAGTVNVPDARKKEFNQCVLELLYKGGIRKTGKIQLAEKEITVVDCAKPDEDGIVHFDYSIFE